MERIVSVGIVLLALAAGAYYLFWNQVVPGVWDLSAEESTFHFSSTKNGDITEKHSITGLQGGFDLRGDTFEVQIDLTTLSTGIDIRDERMREFLFEVEQYPVATLTTTYQNSHISGLDEGTTKRRTFNATLDLHGVKKDFEVVVNIERQTWNRAVMTLAEPLVIRASDFNLDGGLEKLKELAFLDNISEEVPIEFRLVFLGSTYAEADGRD